ncbi:hypothetical protein F4678DRAFT_134042 [Xylaria arbuscula]|nr:hypothetical protein F4678DRAFT_134042 [Xylaria arbuscula]
MFYTPSAEYLASLSPDYLAVDIHQELLDTAIALLVVNTVVYALFIISRASCAERNTWEIWVLYPFSYLTTIVLCIICILFVRYGGIGRHADYWYLHDPGTFAEFLKIEVAAEFIYLVGVTLPKVCIVKMYLNIFIEARTRLITKIILAAIIANLVATVILTFTICQPFAFKWDKSIPNGRCDNLTAAYRYISIPNIVIDLPILFIPIPAIRKLQASRVRKVGLIITFVTGGLGIITAILRFVGFFMVDLEADPTYFGVETQIYTTVEPSAYFICSCLPGMRPLLRKISHSKSVKNMMNTFHRSLALLSKENKDSIHDDIHLVDSRENPKALVAA